MKRLVLVCVIGIISLPLAALENQNWLTGYSWYLGREDLNPVMYQDIMPHANFGTFAKPNDGFVVYHCRWRKDLFGYFYQRTADREHVFCLNADIDHDGKDDELEVHQRENYSYMFLVNKQGSPYAGGKRADGQRIEGHPLIGIWGDMPDVAELRLVEPAEYSIYVDIDPIPFFAIRSGEYLFKQIADNVFETDSSFPDGHMRLEIRSDHLIVLIPLFTLPGENGMVQPMFWWRGPKKTE
jgi:hypothetical protein